MQKHLIELSLGSRVKMRGCTPSTMTKTVQSREEVASFSCCAERCQVTSLWKECVSVWMRDLLEAMVLMASLVDSYPSGAVVQIHFRYPLKT